MLISRTDSLLLIVDLQEKLAPAIHDNEAVAANAVRLLEAARLLAVPACVSEQYVKGLGPSLPAICSAGSAAQFFEKVHFSCAAEPGVLELLQAHEKRQIILCGTETHVCVLQSALGLLAAGFQVFLVEDAAGSRTPENRRAAIERLRAAGVSIVTTEMVLFEWLHRAANEDFRRLLPLIK
ncbi:hydrolase [Azonexus sp.]|uniref:hydrolase n=1 Tax=Azonexus sp. TaxID=1872668 RepID=UPI0039E2AE61